MGYDLQSSCLRCRFVLEIQVGVSLETCQVVLAFGKENTEVDEQLDTDISQNQSRAGKCL